MERKIEVCIGTDRMGCIRARLSLLLIEDGEVISEHYHSIGIEPGADLAMLRATNEAHIALKGGGVPGAPWPKIPDEAWAKVEAVVSIVQTPSVVDRWKEMQRVNEEKHKVDNG